MTNTKQSKAQKKKEVKDALQKEIADKLSHTGTAQFVATLKPPPARHATNLLQQGRYQEFLTVKEAWCLHLLHHLMSENTHIVPPSPALSASTRLAENFEWLGYKGGSTFTPDRFNWGTKFTESSTTDVKPQRPLLAGHEVNYLPVEGRAFTSYPMTGNVQTFIWVDPFDWENPIRINQGPDRTAFQGSFRSLPPYDGGIDASYTSYTQGWSTGYDPRIVPTEWVNHEGLDPLMAGATYRNLQIYPAIEPYVAAVHDPAIFSATNLIEWICDVELTVSVTNPTAFSATSMRARTQDSTQHRFSERCEDPATGDYGFTGPFINANFAEARWRGSTWHVPTVYRQFNVSTGALSELPNSGFGNVSNEPLGMTNWHSLQRCLAEMMPVIEIQQNADSPTRRVDLSIEVKIKKCLVPVFLTTTTLSREHLSFPGRLPRWYQPLCYEAAISPVDTSVVHSTVPYTLPLKTQMYTSAVTALHRDASNNRAIQHLAIQSPPVLGTVGKQHKSVLEKIANAGALANAVVHEAADTANTGYGIGKGLLTLGKTIWSGMKGLGSYLGKGVRAIEPIAEAALAAA